MAEIREEKESVPDTNQRPFVVSDSTTEDDSYDQSRQDEVLPWWKTLALILLMPLCSTAVQLPLTPSHGSIPAMEYHQMAFQSCILVYFAWRMIYTGRPLISLSAQMAFIPVLAAWIPVISHFLTPGARTLGPAYNAALIKAVTWLPLQGLLLNVIRTSIERSFPQSDFIAGLGALGIYFGTDHAWSAYQDHILSLFYGLVRPYMMLLLSLILMALLPARWLRWALVAFPHTLFWNPHSMLALPSLYIYKAPSEILHREGFSVVTKTESVTGYLSVLENVQEGYRMMRCDHSILGGNWIAGLGSWAGGEKPTLKVGRVSEPIYAVFVMLEAVRLVQGTDGSASSVADNQAQALNIGLGIGTTPSALIAHGVNTTVVELDPAVHRLATDYFGLPPNHTAVLEDALTFVKRELALPVYKQYDYIIHDVFTGGAEPAALFTVEFISSLKQLLKPDGVIAINYASDLDLPSTKLDAVEEEGSKHGNFVNMVLFCRKKDGHFSFRNAIESDYLGTSTRKTYLEPRLELDLGKYVPRGLDQRLEANASLVLHAEETRELEKWHGLAARRHWEVMRTVVPDVVWELW